MKDISQTTKYLQSHPEQKIKYAYARLKAQAKYRNEPFELTLEEYIELWDGKIEQKGRGKNQLRMTRQDRTKAWSKNNILIGTQSQIDTVSRQKASIYHPDEDRWDF